MISIQNQEKHRRLCSYRIRRAIPPALLPALLALVLLLLPVAAGAEALTGTLNVNTATVEELMRLPYVGEARARSIVDYRKTHGPFTSLEQLTASKAIGQSTFEAIRSYLRISGASTLAAGGDDAGLTAASLFATEDGDIRVLEDRDYYKALLLAIDQAKERIDMVMFLFKTTDHAKNQPARIVRALAAARDRGVDVRVILERSDYDGDLNVENQRVAAQLRKHGIRVDFDSPETTTHAKMVVVDHRWVFVGSHNLTHSALNRNHEFSLLVDDPDLAGQATAYLMKIR